MGYPDYSQLANYGVAAPAQQAPLIQNQLAFNPQAYAAYGQAPAQFTPGDFSLQPTNMNIQGAQAPAAGGGWSNAIGNFGMVAQGVGSLAGAYLGFQQLQQAKEALGFQKEAFRTNLTNQIATYNTSLEDRIRGRTSAHAGKEAEVQSYLDAHKLKKSG